MAMASTSTMTEEEQGARQVPITLHTAQHTLSIPSIPYLIPTSWRRSQLSTLVNRLLQQDGADATTTKSIPFDFIINGELLRTSLSQYLASKGLTEESTVEIEYVRSTLPPTFTAAFEHDDWVSGVDAGRDGYFLTSSYDGSLRVFGTATIDKALQTLSTGPTSSLTDVCWIPNSDRVASSSMDGLLRISHMNVTGSDEARAPRPISASSVHAMGVPMPLSSVKVDASGNRLLTAGWDGCVAVWGAEQGREEQRVQERSKKRRKGAAGETAEEEQTEATASMAPLSLFWHTPPSNMVDKTPATKSRVAGAVWGVGTNTAYSAGWDGNVRQWDVETGAASSTKTSDKVVLCLDTLVDVPDTVVTGQMDRNAALWDMRAPATNISLSFAGAHAGPICAVRRHPTSSHLFLTGAHDGQVKLWDTRSNHVALFSLVRPSKSKVLTLDWDSTGQTVVAGGEDCKLTVHRGQGIGREDVGM